jgi:hypothetical protein
MRHFMSSVSTASTWASARSETDTAVKQSAATLKNAAEATEACPRSSGSQPRPTKLASIAEEVPPTTTVPPVQPEAALVAGRMHRRERWAQTHESARAMYLVLLRLNMRTQGYKCDETYFSTCRQQAVEALRKLPTWDASWEVEPLYLDKGWWWVRVPCLYNARWFSVHETALPPEVVQQKLTLHSRTRVPFFDVAEEHLPAPQPLCMRSEEAQARESLLRTFRNVPRVP